MERSDTFLRTRGSGTQPFDWAKEAHSLPVKRSSASFCANALTLGNLRISRSTNILAIERVQSVTVTVATYLDTLTLSGFCCRMFQTFDLFLL